MGAAFTFSAVHKHPAACLGSLDLQDLRDGLSGKALTCPHMIVPFNVPCSIGNEPDLVREAIANRHLSGNGPFTQKVHSVFEGEMGFEKVLLTNSCTAALEMAALLCAFEPGDEVILPSFTHVGTANAFERAGATLVFADSLPHHPNVDPDSVAALIGPRTRAIVLVHYAGVACEMERFVALCRTHHLLLIEDAAHAIGAFYKGQALGTFGDLAAFSFHETKNLTCGQGGLLVLNKPDFVERALRIWENGTNRAAFFRGEVDHYTWVDTGSCFLPSDLNAAYLYGQLLARAEILSRRMSLWNAYHTRLAAFHSAHSSWKLPWIHPDGAHNGHIFYLSFPEENTRNQLLAHLNGQGIKAVFHYIPLHSSPHFADRYQGAPLPHCQHHSECVLRLPLFHSLDLAILDRICASTIQFLEGKEVAY